MQIACPKCQQSLTIPQPAPERMPCPNCQAVLRLAPVKPAQPAPTPAPVPAPATTQTVTARLVAGFELQRELARGGLGVVFLAYHPHLKHYRAIKRPLPRADLDTEVLLGRFRREMEALGALESKNIIRAHDAGTDVDGPYLVTEYLDGEALSSLVSRHRQLPFSEACELVRQVALGLQAAHEAGMVHRDIKPSNLMLARAVGGTARVVIIDWGLVKRNSEADAPANRLTKIHTSLGTPDFIPPEQIRDAHGVDIRADIYSLGATLYYLLAGRAPFHGRSEEQKQLAQTREEFPPLEQIRPDVPANVLNVLSRMVKKNPAERFQTPGEVVAALAPFSCADAHRMLALLAPVAPASVPGADTGRILDEKTQLVTAPPPAAPTTTPGLSSQPLIVWGVLGGGALLVLLTCVIVSVIIGLSGLRPRKDTKDAKDDVQIAKDKTDADGQKGKDKETKQHAWLISPPAGPVLEASEQGLVKTMTGDSYYCTAVAFLPDGLRAVTRSQFLVHVWDLKNQRHSGTSWGFPTNSVGLVAASPNGKIIAASTGSNVSRYDGKTYKLIPAPRLLDSWCTGLAFSPDSKILATAEQDGIKGRIRFWDAEKGSPYGDKDLTLDTPVVSLAFSPDGNVLLTSTANISTSDLRSLNTGERKIALWSMKDHKRLLELDGHPDAAAAAAFFADGKRIFTASPFDGTLRVWSVTGKEHTDLRTQAGPYLLKDELKKDPNDPRQISCAAFWPWGRALIGYRHGGLKLYDMNKGAKIWESENKSSTPGIVASAVAISPDGHHALLAMSDSKVYLFRLPAP